MKEEKACQTCKHKYTCLDQMRKVGSTLCIDNKLDKYEKEENEKA